VSRTDVEDEVLSPGRVASSHSTEIRCTLERLEAAGQGMVAGASTILSLVPEGSVVKKGDILCELDASAYMELVRRQQIAVEQAKTEHLQASLTLEVAKIDLQAYRDAEKLQVERDLKGQLVLATSDLTRQADRLAWLQRMLVKGYSSVAQIKSEQQSQLRLSLGLDSLNRSLQNYERFTFPKNDLSLQSKVIGAQSTLNFQTIRLNREVERLAHYQSMVDRCTIRAPHDGFVVYANRRGRDLRVFEGATVRERMPLFTLPDQSKMKVEVLLHETAVNLVRPGMKASINVEALSGRAMEGILDSVSQVPLSDQSSEGSGQVTYFLGQIQLTRPLPGLRPDMSVQVTIMRGLRRSVLTIPKRAVRQEKGQDVCYVAGRGRLERRAVTVRHATHDLIEVVAGLNEGEKVILDPTQIDTFTSLVMSPQGAPPGPSSNSHPALKRSDDTGP
jgi:HlyD family secretion protein